MIVKIRIWSDLGEFGPQMLQVDEEIDGCFLF